jgi:Do/DeqQ family serine protease
MLSKALRHAASLFLLLGISLTAEPPAMAQQRQLPQIPDSRQQITLSFAPVVKQVAPAVVNIYTRTVVQSRQAQSPLFDDPFFRRFFENSPLGQPRQRVQSSLGSGVIVDASGLIVTNFHVVKGSTEITVVLSDRREFDAKVELADERTDLAVLRIDAGAERLPTVHIRDSDDLEVGDLVLAIGNPFGVGQTVTSGIVSALARTTVGIADYRFFIQTDAAINPGNSGGALVTMDGGLVGINSAIYSRSGGSIGIGFAVPSNMVRAVLAGVGAGQRLVRPWFGAGGQTVTSELATNLGLPRPEGVLINNIYPNGPAARGGLRQGDIVTEINGREVDDPEALRFRIATLPVGGKAQLAVLRRGQRMVLTLGLEPPPETPPREESLMQGSHPLAGATVANLSPALADELSLGSELTGVTVLKVARGTPGARLGLQARDIVLAVNGSEIDSVERLRQLLGRPAADKRWRVAIKRGDKVFTTVVE